MRSDTPDEFSHAWLRQEFRGLHHAIARTLSDYVDCWETLGNMKERLEAIEAGLESMRAEIGRLRAEQEEFQERCRQAYADLKKEGDAK